jgi:hypothetical protein
MNVKEERSTNTDFVGEIVDAASQTLDVQHDVAITGGIAQEIEMDEFQLRMESFNDADRESVILELADIVSRELHIDCDEVCLRFLTQKEQSRQLVKEFVGIIVETSLHDPQRTAELLHSLSRQALTLARRYPRVEGSSLSTSKKPADCTRSCRPTDFSSILK